MALTISASGSTRPNKQFFNEENSLSAKYAKIFINIQILSGSSSQAEVNSNFPFINFIYTLTNIFYRTCDVYFNSRPPARLGLLEKKNYNIKIVNAGKGELLAKVFLGNWKANFNGIPRGCVRVCVIFVLAASAVQIYFCATSRGDHSRGWGQYAFSRKWQVQTKAGEIPLKIFSRPLLLKLFLKSV